MESSLRWLENIFFFSQGNLYETKKEMYTKNLFHQSLNSGFDWPSFLFLNCIVCPFEYVDISVEVKCDL